MGPAVINFILGAFIKLVSAGFSKFMENKHQRDMALLRINTDQLVALQSGSDTADPFTRWTRRVLALMVIGVFMSILYQLTILKPDTEFTVFVGRQQSPLWAWLNPFPVNDKGVMRVSGGSILWDAWKGIWLILGFYFTKIGR